MDVLGACGGELPLIQVLRLYIKPNLSHQKSRLILAKPDATLFLSEFLIQRSIINTFLFSVQDKTFPPDVKVSPKYAV